MRKILFSVFAILAFLLQAQTSSEVVVVGTTDVHGAFFPHNYLTGKDTSGSLATVMSLLRDTRNNYGEDNVVYIDNGDILQGQPTAYYYNYTDTASKHLAAEILNFMGCDLSTMGNHDVETGHSVYDRWIAQCHQPVLGANIIDASTGLPYLKPYQIIERDGVKIAFLGMITPAIPSWLPENLWSNLKFEDMETSAAKWVPFIKKNERPDVIIGVFHAGQGGSMLNGICDNASDIIAANVPGFDAIMCGHDHRRDCRKVFNAAANDSVLIINSANGAYDAAIINIRVDKDGDGNVTDKCVDGHLEKMKAYAPDSEYMSAFAPQIQAIEAYVNQKVGEIDTTISCASALQGPCEFMELIHRLQLAVSDGARISIASPLAMNAVIEKGDITVRDMFNLYKYENLLYTMALTGEEIKNLLEMSYDLWINKEGPSYNYDSAFGIDYEVDTAKPKGERVIIRSFSDGSPFSLGDTYKVAINSYRGNGGGDLLTLGSGIPKTELQKRILSSTDKDLRYYLMQHIRDVKHISPSLTPNWKFK